MSLKTYDRFTFMKMKHFFLWSELYEFDIAIAMTMESFLQQERIKLQNN